MIGGHGDNFVQSEADIYCWYSVVLFHLGIEIRCESLLGTSSRENYDSCIGQFFYKLHVHKLSDSHSMIAKLWRNSPYLVRVKLWSSVETMGAIWQDTPSHTLCWDTESNVWGIHTEKKRPLAFWILSPTHWKESKCQSRLTNANKSQVACSKGK